MKKRLFKYVHKCWKSLFMDKHESAFVQFNKERWSSWRVGNADGVVLINSFCEPASIIGYTFYANIIAKKNNARLVGFGSFNRVYQCIYRSFNVVEFIDQIKYSKNVTSEINCESEFNKITNKRDLLDYEFHGINIGVAIYESYLREGKSTVDFFDDRLKELFILGIKMLAFWDEYFSNHMVKAVISSHDCYLQFDVVNRVAYKHNVTVFIPTTMWCAKSRYPYNLYQIYKDYHTIFMSFDANKRREALCWAKEQLDKRFSGEIGVGMYYSTKSAFLPINKAQQVMKKTNKIKVLICSHCFFDNPHAYGKMYFPDFYEWLSYIGSIADKTDYDWYIKVHPDPLPGTVEKIKKIIKAHPKITLIDVDCSHLQLAYEGLDYVLTCYGTVGEEYPLLGVEVINASYNPRIAYDFNMHCLNINDYETILLNLKKSDYRCDVEKVYEYYYMKHYYSALYDDMIFYSYKDVAKKVGFNIGRLSPTSVYTEFINECSDERFMDLLNKFSGFINSKYTHYYEFINNSNIVTTLI